MTWGWDKEAALYAARKQAEEEAKVEPLEPPFPYYPIAFDPAFFSIPHDPESLDD